MTDNDKAKSDEKKNEALRQQVEELVKREWVETTHEIDINGNNHYFRSVFAAVARNREDSLPIHGLILQRTAPPL